MTLGHILMSMIIQGMVVSKEQIINSLYPGRGGSLEGTDS